MSVTSYLALYTTLLGWQQYNNLWGIAVGIGMIYLSFLSIILSNTMQPFISMGAKDAAQIAVRRLFISVLIALFVIAFAAVPTIPLEPKVLHYEPPCSTSSMRATPGHTGTTYDNAFPVPTGVKVPVFWYLVMAVSNGVTHAAIDGLSCAPINYRNLHSQLALSRIQNPQLKQETTEFYQDCYVPANFTYLSHDFSETQQAKINQYLKQYGEDDTSWLGSQVFLNVSGFYNTLKAKNPINGFPFDADRDQTEGQVKNHSKWGEPNCANWWTDSSVGLHQKLLTVLKPGFLEELAHFGNKSKDLDDVAIRTLIQQSFNHNPNDLSRGYESSEDYDNSHWLSKYAGIPVGITSYSMTFFPKIVALKNALPIIQAAILFALYVFLALAIPFSSYRIQFCITGAIVLFSVIFCSFIWHLVDWFDAQLIQTLYPSMFSIAGIKGILDGSVSYDMPNVKLVEMIIGTLYIVLPLFWLAIMSWAGFKVGQFMTGLLIPMGAPASSIGNEARSAARNAMSTGSKLLK